ncbi:DedA family protein [Streptomyces sp. NPDC059063]|uniref:DedA family protein n=1 Tax=unclassified Streptomyces TaxID=2593676 RepID=UPI0036739857
MTTPLTGVLDQVPAPCAYALLGGAVLLESVLLVGAFVPTLALLLTAGALARAGELSLVPAVVVAAGAAVAGDALGHRTGRVLGVRLRGGCLGRRIPGVAWRRAEALMERFGGQALFCSRFLPVVRTVTPHLAGATRVPYRRVAAYSVVAATLWAGGGVGVGYAVVSAAA